MPRALIVDDEPLARKRVRRFLQSEPDFEILADCESAEQAISSIEKNAPEIVFLDIQMPVMNGFDVISKLGVQRMPLTVFITAYDEYAVRAFEAHALDYLLKPIKRERFQALLERTRAALRQKKQQLSPELIDLLLQHKASSTALSRIAIRSEGGTILLNASEIDWIQAEGNYVRIQAGTTSHLLRDTLGRLAGDLDARRFLRIHRSTIVNIDRVKELRPWFHGDCLVLMRDGKQLTLSRTYRGRAREFLKQDF